MKKSAYPFSRWYFKIHFYLGIFARFWLNLLISICYPIKNGFPWLWRHFLLVFFFFLAFLSLTFLRYNSRKQFYLQNVNPSTEQISKGKFLTKGIRSCVVFAPLNSLIDLVTTCRFLQQSETKLKKEIASCSLAFSRYLSCLLLLLRVLIGS